MKLFALALASALGAAPLARAASTSPAAASTPSAAASTPSAAASTPSAAASTPSAAASTPSAAASTPASPVLPPSVAPSSGRPATEITADEAVALYRARSPRLAAHRAELDITAADRVDAIVYPNPTLSISTTNIAQGQDTFGHSQETIGLDIPILIGRQRGHRERAAEAHITARRAELDLDQATAELAIRHRFTALAAAQDKLLALTAALDDAGRVRAIVAGRQQAGAKSPYELERTDLALAALTSRRDEATTDVGVASATLAQAVGIADWQPRAVGNLTLTDEASPPAAGDRAGAVAPAVSDAGRVAHPAGDAAGLDNAAPSLAADHPALVVGRAAEASARSDEALAHAEAIPTPSLQLQGFGTTDPQGIAVTVGIAIPLPVFDRNQGAVARARAHQRAAELDQRATTDELTSDLARAVAAERARRAAATQFHADAVARLPGVRTMAEAAYRAGQGGLIELLDALDAITEARLREIDLVAAALDAAIDVRAAARGR